MTKGMTVKELRQISGLSQAAFGEKYHIPVRTVENWEGGVRKPSDTILYLLDRMVREDFADNLTDETKRYLVFRVGGENDGKTVFATDSEIQAKEEAWRLCEKYDEMYEDDPAYMGFGIVDQQTDETIEY
jgi:transcriptional regulator with XRE-family HTH domain